jgi:hypothetical protein
MPIGIDDAANFVALVGFAAGFLESCIKGLLILSKARSYGRDISGINLMIELELHKLHAWGVEVGLSREPPTLLVDAQHALVVPKVLTHLHDLISDLNKMRSEFGLQLEETKEHFTRLNDNESAFERLGIEANDGCENVLSKIFRKKTQPWRVLKWITFDEKKVRNLLSQINYFRQELEQIIDATRQAKIARAADMLARNAVLSTANEQDLDMIGFDTGEYALGREVAAAARLKKQGLLLGMMDIDYVSSKHEPNSPRSSAHWSYRKNSYPLLMPRYSNNDLAAMRISATLISDSTYVEPMPRFLARCEGEPVLLEFKSDSVLNHEALKDRVCKVAAFLRDLNESFHGLSCRGYVKVYNRYAYVFDLKAVVNVKDAKSGPALRTLRELLDETGAPSVNLRISFAITLLETLLQLHTSGWLHKEFRSDNVIFLRDTFDYVDDFLSAPMRVTGYAYARADQPQEPTEPLQSEVELDLYRHPRCLGHAREFFRRAFDIFSVGCILLEIGFWCSLSSLFRRESGHSQRSELQTLDLLRIRREMLFSPASEKAYGVKRKPVNGAIKCDRSDIFCKLQASMGKGYSEVVKALIHTPDLEDKAHASTSTKSEAYHGGNLLDLEMDCLERLRRIAAVL